MAFYANAPLPDTNARQSAQTIRMPSTALLTIDSEDRYKDYNQAFAAPTSPYNFTISKNESLMPGFMTRLGISEVVFPWTIPNITQKTYQMTCSYYYDGDLQTEFVQIESGFYTPQQLAAAVAAYVNILPNIPAGFEMTYGGNDPTEGVEPYFFYTCSQPIAFGRMTPNSVQWPYSANTKQLFNVLGFDAGNSVLAAPGSGVMAARGNYTLCQSIRYVDIVCNQLTNSQAQKDQTSQTIARDMLCRLYVGGAPGVSSTTEANSATFCPPGCAPTVIYRNFATPKQIQWIPNQNIPGFLQFQVYDDTGDLLDTDVIITNKIYPAQTSDWSMTLLVSEN